jgi:hypothetical protein
MFTVNSEVSVSPPGSPASWTRPFREFRCPSCNATKAYRSRYRGVVEQMLLFPLMLKPVRCDRCYHRSYILRVVPVLERGAHAGKLDNQSSRDSGAGTRVA